MLRVYLAVITEKYFLIDKTLSSYILYLSAFQNKIRINISWGIRPCITVFYLVLPCNAV